MKLSECNRKGYYAIVLAVLTAWSLVSILLYSALWKETSTMEAAQHHQERKKLNTPEPNDDKTVSQDCVNLNFDKDMDKLLSKYKQVFIEMPAKAAGTTFKEFTKACMATTNTSSFARIDNPLPFKHIMNQAFESQLKIPSLIASHIYFTPQPIHDTMVHATEDTLIIYSYREETSRLISAIKHVVHIMCRDAKRGAIVIEPGECQMQERKLSEMIREKPREIGIGIPQHLTCKTYEVIKDNNPNLVFVHYKKASQLQKLLAKHHCPKVTKEFREKVAAEKKMNLSVVLEGQANNGTIVSLDDWLDAKRQLLGHIFDLRKDASCQATTKDIQYELLRCPDETLQVSGRSYENRKVLFPF